MRQLTNEEIGHLVDLLLACPSIQNDGARVAVLEYLPEHITSAISRHSQKRVEVWNIVRTCMNFAEGLDELVEATQFFDKGSLPMQALERKVEELFPQPISRAHIAHLQHVLSRVTVPDTDLRQLYQSSAPRGPDWVYPQGHNEADTLARILRQLAKAPVKKPGQTHPLLDFISHLVGMNIALEQTAQDELRTWTETVAQALGIPPVQIAAQPHPVGRDGGVPPARTLFVNRRDELQVFEQLLRFEESRRIMVLHDKAGTGKSFLLRRFQRVVRQRYMPMCFMELADIRSPMALIEGIYQDLKDDDSPLEFPEYEQLREAKSPRWDAMVKDPQVQQRDYEVAARERPGSGSEFTSAPRTSSLAWMDEQKAFRAFRHDLWKICQNQPVVILLDTYEALDANLKEWFLQKFIWHLAIRPDAARHQLLLVIAGQERPELETFYSPQQHQDRVYEIPELSRWTKGDIQDCMYAYGVAPDERTVDVLYEKAQSGLNTLVIVSFIRELKSIQPLE